MKRKKGERKKGRKESNFIIPKSKNSFLIAFEAPLKASIVPAQ
jgi:hypothetical protein